MESKIDKPVACNSSDVNSYNPEFMKEAIRIARGECKEWDRGTVRGGSRTGR